jgi:hypothetical protein
VARDLTLLALLVALVATMAAHAQRSRGLSIVATASAAAPATVVDCSVGEVEERVACLRRSIRTTLRSGGDLAWALRSINERARHDELLAARCHMLLHEEGRTWHGRLAPHTVEHDGKDCAAGFLHGWMLSHLGGDGRLDASTVDAWCAPPATALGRADCEHGMGHVLVRNLGGDLPLALARCRELGSDTRYRNCASGAFMENRAGGRGRDGAAVSRWWRRGEPWLPCRTAAPADLVDVCAAWAVRDVASERRLGWCRGIARHASSRACLVGAGVVAPASRSGERTCAQVEPCWWGRGYAWAMLTTADGDVATERCRAASEPRLRRACQHGVAFRRDATRPDGGDVSRVVEVAWA